MKLCLKWFCLFNWSFALILSQNGYQLIFVQIGDGMIINHLKALSQPLIGKLNLLIIFKSVLKRRYHCKILKYSWTLFNLLKVIIRICINIAFLILILYFVLEIFVIYVTIKSKTDIAIFIFILEFETKYKNVFTYIHLPLYGISLYFRNVLYSKEEFYVLFQ